MKVAVAAAILLKGVGGVLFIFGSTSGALLLVCNRILLLDLIFIQCAQFFML